MDDLICPECGRPNLAEAKKCWYCQTELVRLDENPNDRSDPVSQTPSPTLNDPAEEMPDGMQEEDVPEWLAKIRHKIEEEQGPQEELPYWKQKDIFGGEKDLKPKPAKEKKTRSAPDQPDKKPNVEMTKGTLERVVEEKPTQDSDDDTLSDNLSDDLPDGFIKL